MSNNSGFGSFGSPAPAPSTAASPAPTPTGNTTNPFVTSPPPVPPTGAPIARPAAAGAGRVIKTKNQSPDQRQLGVTGTVVKLQEPAGNHENFSNGDSAIDGVCPFDFDPANRSDNPSPRVVIWTSRGNSAVDVQQAPALRFKPTPNVQGDFDILTDLGFYVRVPQSVGRIVAVEDLFSPKALVLYGDNRQASPADYPMAAVWRPFVKTCKPRFDNGAIVYQVELHGLEGVISRRYAGAEIETGGEPPDSANPESHLRIMVWPRNPPPKWRLFVVDVGANANDLYWNGVFKSSLYHHPAGRNEGQRVAPCRSVKDGSELLSLKEGSFLPDLPTRVATSDRPNYIEIRRLGEEAVVGTFTLLEHIDSSTPQHAIGHPEEWSVDIGTSNSCIARRDPSTPDVTLIVDLNQVTPSRIGGEAAPSLVLSRLGDPLNPRSEVQWMAGIEAPNNPEAGANIPITQMPSRLSLLTRDRLPDALTVQEVRALVPMCDAVVPPLQSEKFGLMPVNDRTVDKLKWVEKHDTKRVALLELYIANMLLMAAARVRPTSTVSVRFSQPLAFNEAEKEGLLEAARGAAKRLTDLTGVPFEARVDSDESHCILEEFASLNAGEQGFQPLWVLCDIGGGSIDIAVATGENCKNYAVMAADSIRFGANLVFDNLLELAGQQVSLSTDPKIQRHRVREMISQQGYGAVLARCNPSTKDKITNIVQLYFELVAEYVARTVAGCIRNPKRLKGLLGKAPGGFGWTADAPAHLLSRIELLVTGNGFRTFEVLNRGARMMQLFTERVKSRCAELIQAPTGIPSVAADDDTFFAQVPPPDAAGYLGLAPPGGVTYLKEALAYSILHSSGQGNGEDRYAEDFLSAPNGITEYSAPWPARNIPGSQRPWYAFVGSAEKIARSNPTAGVYKVDRTEPWFVENPTISRDEKAFGPPMPGEVLRLAADLKWNLDLNYLCQQNISELTRLLKGVSGKRQWSLLKVIYECAIRGMFSSSDFLR